MKEQADQRLKRFLAAVIGFSGIVSTLAGLLQHLELAVVIIVLGILVILGLLVFSVWTRTSTVRPHRYATWVRWLALAGYVVLIAAAGAITIINLQVRRYVCIATGRSDCTTTLRIDDIPIPAAVPSVAVGVLRSVPPDPICGPVEDNLLASLPKSLPEGMRDYVIALDPSAAANGQDLPNVVVSVNCHAAASTTSVHLDLPKLLSAADLQRGAPQTLDWTWTKNAWVFLAEPQSFDLTWPAGKQPDVTLLAAIVAYYGGDMQQAVTRLNQSSLSTDPFTGNEKAALELVWGNTMLRQPAMPIDQVPWLYGQALLDAGADVHQDKNLMAALYNNTGVAYLMNGDTTAARDMLDTAVKLYASYPWLYVNRTQTRDNPRDPLNAQDCKDAQTRFGVKTLAVGYVCMARYYHFIGKKASLDDRANLVKGLQSVPPDSKYKPLADYYVATDACDTSRLAVGRDNFVEMAKITADQSLRSKAQAALDGPCKS